MTQIHGGYEFAGQCCQSGLHTYPKPSILQTTAAAASLKKSPHTVPHVPL